MFLKKEVVLTETATESALLTITSHLHHREQKDEKLHYKGTIAIRLFEYPKETGSFTYFLAKKEAKYLFHRLLHKKCKEPIVYESDASAVQAKKQLTITRFSDVFEEERFLIEIVQQVTGKEDERARIIISIDEVKMIALECLDYIRHEETVAQMNGQPLYDQIMHPPISNADKDESLMEFDEFIESMLNGDEDVEKQAESEMETSGTHTIPQCVRQLETELTTYLANGTEIPLSKEELDEVLNTMHAWAPYIHALKTINNLR